MQNHNDTRFVVSTIGTSILTNSIDRATEGNWFGILGASANLKEGEGELSDESKGVIDELAKRARGRLSQNDVGTHRSASAELNGIYGIYEGTLPKQNAENAENAENADQHYLICTDTFQGQTTGNLIKDFLEKKGFKADIFVPSSLSTKDTNSFTDGIKELIQWLENNLPGQRDSGNQVIFNLVGGFKSLQGYMQTFGTFYADETVYIFEGSSDLIKIPRLPIQIDTIEIHKYRKQFSMMAAEAPCLITEDKDIGNISKTLLHIFEDGGKSYVGLSAWGTLIWNRTKEDLFEKDSHTIQHDLSPKAKAQLALMNAEKQYPEDEIEEDIPEALLKSVPVRGKTYVELSVWGKSVWNKAKKDLLGREDGLLLFQRLQYKDSFIYDFKKKNNNDQRIKLQETLAKVVYLLDKHSGSTKGLTGGDLKYDSYTSHPDIYHFRVDGSRRVSCKPDGGNLILRHCGAHDYVNNNP